MDTWIWVNSINLLPPLFIHLFLYLLLSRLFGCKRKAIQTILGKKEWIERQLEQLRRIRRPGNKYNQGKEGLQNQCRSLLPSPTDGLASWFIVFCPLLSSASLFATFIIGCSAVPYLLPGHSLCLNESRYDFGSVPLIMSLHSHPNQLSSHYLNC